MNILFLSLLYHPDDARETSALSRTGLQNQANGFQWAMIEGIRKNLEEGEMLSVLNSLPVGVYPRQYRKLRLRGKAVGVGFREIGSLNLPYFKQKRRKRAAEREIEAWAMQSPLNRTVVIYSLYLPYMRAAAVVKRRIPDLKACMIVTDLPGDLGVASGRQGIMKKIEYMRGRKSIWLVAEMNGLIMLTKQMAVPLFALHQKLCVIEGMTAAINAEPEPIDMPDDARPAVLYTGTLNRELGIDILLNAFSGMSEYQLWLCGKGDMEDAIREAQAKLDNIRYFGFVRQAQAVYLQGKAAILINPRTNGGIYTRYSFPSKTMEYMRAGKPVLCCRLDGIPLEYDEYLNYIKPQDAQGIRDAVRGLMALPQHERDGIGRRASEFVLKEKNNITQGKKALDLLRSL
ncbi:MAG: glycosyltransferase [Clostridiales bacterium]|nr:glycosyltransferase [Clostridiales bacterium]